MSSSCFIANFPNRNFFLETKSVANRVYIFACLTRTRSPARATPKAQTHIYTQTQQTKSDQRHTSLKNGCKDGD